MGRESERTFVLMKRDLWKDLLSDTFALFMRKGYTSCGLKLTAPSEDLLRKQFSWVGSYIVHKQVAYMRSGPVVAMCWEGENVVENSQLILGEIKYREGLSGGYDMDSTDAILKNGIYTSKSREKAKRDLEEWFEPSELHGKTKKRDSWLHY